MHDSIAYTYEAGYNCENCALARFGRDNDGFITGTDSEGNEVGVIAPWDEWMQFDDSPEILACADCGAIIDEYEMGDFGIGVGEIKCEHPGNKDCGNGGCWYC